MKNQETYRIKTNLGETKPINIPVSLMQEYNSFEILSLKINTNETYRSYTSNEGIVVGRVSTANNGLGIPNVRVSIFVPKGMYNQDEEEAVLYPFSSPTDLNGDRVRYNLLPSDSDVECYQVVGTMPTKRQILDNETVCEVFEKYYKYTTVTNEAGDFMLTNIPVGRQRLHIDADLSDIGPFLSQKPYNMIENLGFEKNKFESTRQFKTSNDLDSLVQIISQNKSIYVYPYWGDTTENSAEMKITRTDLSLNYDFKTQAVFMGSIITDKGSNSIRQNCTATEYAGKMSEMITGPGRIEMIRKTIDNKIEQYKVKGDALINENGVWCYAIPMNLDYVRTDEYGNIIPTDDPNKGVPTRARVRFRITLEQMESDSDSHKRCSYLVPNNPKIDDEMFLITNDADYSFGSETWDESFVDLFWNKVYTVKNFVPRFQKSARHTNRKHTGIKMVNHFGDNNPFPYNNLSIRLPFVYRFVCVMVDIFLDLVLALNTVLCVIGALPCTLASWCFRLPLIGRICLFGWAKKFIPTCIGISPNFCDDGINRFETFPGCTGCVWDLTYDECIEEQKSSSERGEDEGMCLRKSDMLLNCIENQLAQSNEATSFDFSQDWINGCLYMPLWYRHIKPKKSFFFGLFKRKAKDQWCANENVQEIKYISFCNQSNTVSVSSTDFNGKPIEFHIAGASDSCGDGCNEEKSWLTLNSGVIVNRETNLGQKVWYYKAIDITDAISNNMAAEYMNKNNQAMTARFLYATDIVLLGSLSDCDMNGTPKFFNYLKSSTYEMPSDLLFTDTDISYKVDSEGKLVSQEVTQTSVASGCDWGNKNEYGYDDGGLFYSIGCNDVEVDTPSCINLRRICELGVGLDEMQYIENLNVNINSDVDQLDYGNQDYYLRPDGFISYDDIIDFDYRSMFATLNGNRLRTKINEENGVREYDFKHYYIDNFDGSLMQFMRGVQSGRNYANYKNNWRLESTNIDYLMFRFGDRPFFYDGNSLVIPSRPNNGPGSYRLPKYQNSFYFYFGLKEGKTAIDLFNQEYNQPCSTKTNIDDNIQYDKSPNGWCVMDDDDNGTYNHGSYDGYIKFNLENITLPCTLIFNSQTNAGVSYEVNQVTDEKICFYGSNNDIWRKNKTKVEQVFGGYKKMILNYENEEWDEPKECEMINNGTYDLIIVDGNGNFNTMVVELKGNILRFETSTENFKQTNDVLLELYNSYDGVAKDDNNDDVYEVKIDDDGLVKTNRKDVVKERRINGTITLYNVLESGDYLDRFLIEVYSKDEDLSGENYVYHPIGLVDISNGRIVDVTEGNGDYITLKDDSKYFHYYNAKGSDNNNIPCCIVNCPKGNVEYTVKITQICEDNNGRYYKTLNYNLTKVLINQPQPYKMFINGIDYDVIKNFKTGWVLDDTQKNMQTYNGNGPTPFKSWWTKSIKGWDNFGDLSNYNWNADIKKYGSNDDKTLNEKDKTTGEYLLIKELNDKKNSEPLEPNTNIVDYEKKYSEWEVKHHRWEEELEQIQNKATLLQNRLDFVDKMKEAFWLMCKEDEKTIICEVRTDDSPYDVWLMYNPEIRIDLDTESINLLESSDTGWTGWKYVGESTQRLNGIRVPTLTHSSSTEYANGPQENGLCFAADFKAAVYQDSMYVNYKPPYFVACVNAEGITKPEGLKEKDFFALVKNKNGLNKYSFGNVKGNNGMLSDGNGNEFFGFHIMDKIFDINFVSWSYINNIPYFRPDITYDYEEGKWKEYVDYDFNENSLTVDANGLCAGKIYNGITKSKGYVDDFDKATISGEKLVIKTIVGEGESYDEVEFKTPTERIILMCKKIENEWEFNGKLEYGTLVKGAEHSGWYKFNGKIVYYLETIQRVLVVCENVNTDWKYTMPLDIKSEVKDNRNSDIYDGAYMLSGNFIEVKDNKIENYIKNINFEWSYEEPLELRKTVIEKKNGSKVSNGYYIFNGLGYKIENSIPTEIYRVFNNDENKDLFVGEYFYVEDVYGNYIFEETVHNSIIYNVIIDSKYQANDIIGEKTVDTFFNPTNELYNNKKRCKAIYIDKDGDMVFDGEQNTPLYIMLNDVGNYHKGQILTLNDLDKDLNAGEDYDRAYLIASELTKYISDDVYVNLTDEEKKKCEKEYIVKEIFNKYDVDELLTQKQYDGLTDNERKNFCEKAYVINEGFYLYDKGTNESNIINSEQYNRLSKYDKAFCSEVYVVKEEFKIDDKTYTVNDVIDSNAYKKLINENKEKCKRMYMVNDNICWYEKEQYISKSVYDNLTKNKQNKCSEDNEYKFIVILSFGYYNIGDVIKESEYAILSKVKQNKCSEGYIEVNVNGRFNESDFTIKDENSGEEYNVWKMVVIDKNIIVSVTNIENLDIIDCEWVFDVPLGVGSVIKDDKGNNVKEGLYMFNKQKVKIDSDSRVSEITKYEGYIEEIPCDWIYEMPLDAGKIVQTENNGKLENVEAGDYFFGGMHYFIDGDSKVWMSEDISGDIEGEVINEWECELPLRPRTEIETEDGQKEIKNGSTVTRYDGNKIEDGIYTLFGKTIRVNDGEVIEIVTPTYNNYKYDTSIMETNQYTELPNSTGKILVSDLNSNCSIEEEVYGAMTINLNKEWKLEEYINAINVYLSEEGYKKFQKAKDKAEDMINFLRREDVKFSVANYYNGWRYGVLTFTCSNVGNSIGSVFLKKEGTEEAEAEKEKIKDDKTTINYYLFSVNKYGNSSRGVTYPINGFIDNHIECYNSTSGNNYSGGFAWNLFRSNVSNEELARVCAVSNDTGKFVIPREVDEYIGYFVIATTNYGRCRAISCVYDFTPIYYCIGIVKKNYGYFLRVYFRNIINKDNSVNNYYLTHYDFSYDLTVSTRMIGKSNKFFEDVKHTAYYNAKDEDDKNYQIFTPYDETKIKDARIGTLFTKEENGKYVIYEKTTPLFTEVTKDEFMDSSYVSEKYDKGNYEGAWYALGITKGLVKGNSVSRNGTALSDGTYVLIDHDKNDENVYRSVTIASGKITNIKNTKETATAIPYNEWNTVNDISKGNEIRNKYIEDEKNGFIISTDNIYYYEIMDGNYQIIKIVFADNKFSSNITYAKEINDDYVELQDGYYMTKATYKDSSGVDKEVIAYWSYGAYDIVKIGETEKNPKNIPFFAKYEDIPINMYYGVDNNGDLEGLTGFAGNGLSVTNNVEIDSFMMLTDVTGLPHNCVKLRVDAVPHDEQYWINELITNWNT